MRLLKWLSLAAAVWMIYWSVAAWGLRSGISAWFAEQERQGWQAEFHDLETRGFPFQHNTLIQTPVLADPGTGTAWRADWLSLESPAIWPGQQRLSFASTPQRFSYFDQTFVLEAQDMHADLQLAPGTALELETLALTTGNWRISQATDELFAADSFDLSMVQNAPTPSYAINIESKGFAPKGEVRRLLQVRRDQPEQFDSLRLKANVTFDTAWDRRALELRRPQPRTIDLMLAELHWGEILLRATGELEIDEQGWVNGELALQLENWRSLLDMLESARLLPQGSAREGLEQLLDLLAKLSGNTDKLDARLRFQDGRTYAGPIPIGAAPRLLLR